MGKLQDWLDQDWVRIDSSGNIAGPCGTSKNKKRPDRCLPRKKAQSLSKSERKSTAQKKKREGAKGKKVVSNTKAATVRMALGGAVPTTKSKRPFNGKRINGTAVARGCGMVMSNRRKRTSGSVTQS
jgi:hypothetical protein|tara:strand:- start:222 stop:602 length:381 start_codon:yes stop_codon:yes gene_type:complete